MENFARIGRTPYSTEDSLSCYYYYYYYYCYCSYQLTRYCILSCVQNGLTALHLASKAGFTELVIELLKRAAPVDAFTKVRLYTSYYFTNDPTNKQALNWLRHLLMALCNNVQIPQWKSTQLYVQTCLLTYWSQEMWSYPGYQPLV